MVHEDCIIYNLRDSHSIGPVSIQGELASHRHGPDKQAERASHVAI